MATGFGFVAEPMVLHLMTADADFIQTIQTSDGSDFPDGAAVTLKIGTASPTLWSATITGPSAAWNVDKAVVAALVPGTALLAHVLYADDSGADLVWFSGKVKWHG